MDNMSVGVFINTVHEEYIKVYGTFKILQK